MTAGRKTRVWATQSGVKSRSTRILQVWRAHPHLLASTARLYDPGRCIASRYCITCWPRTNASVCAPSRSLVPRSRGTTCCSLGVLVCFCMVFVRSPPFAPDSGTPQTITTHQSTSSGFFILEPSRAPQFAVSCYRPFWRLDRASHFCQNGAIFVLPRVILALHTLNSSAESGTYLA